MNQEQLQDLELLLECPVCFEIPRQTPIPQCPSGHIVCSSCRGKVKNKCPTCQRKMKRGEVSSLAASLIEMVPHQCKWCEEKKLLADILDHETECKERKVTCACPCVPCPCVYQPQNKG